MDDAYLNARFDGAHVSAGVAALALVTRDLAVVARALHAEAQILDRTGTDAAVADWCQRAHDCLGAMARSDPDSIALWRALLLPWFLKSDFLRRCHDKPQGYAGDYLTIQTMYDACPAGIGRFGAAVDAWAMDQPCPKAVRNRRVLVREVMRKVCDSFCGRTPSVVSLGSGPAAEIFDVLADVEARFTLVDIDADAVGFVRAKAEALGLAGRVDAMRGNIIKMAYRDEGRLPGGQSAFYSLGVIDYFRDEVVVKLLDYIHAKLAPGGIAFLGNFKPGHPNVALFQHALDWPLILRGEADLLALVRQSKFRDCPVAVGAEAEGVQLFVECRKIG